MNDFLKLKQNNKSNSNKKLKETNKFLTKLVGILLVISVLIFVLGMSGFLFQFSPITTGVINLGDIVNIKININKAVAIPISFNNLILPNDIYIQRVRIQSEDLNPDCYLRARIFMPYNANSVTEVEVETTTFWLKGNDNYYYYNGVLSEGQIVDFINELTIPDISLVNDFKTIGNIVVMIETITLESNVVSTLWTNKPDNWLL